MLTLALITPPQHVREEFHKIEQLIATSLHFGHPFTEADELERDSTASQSFLPMIDSDYIYRLSSDQPQGADAQAGAQASGSAPPYNDSDLAC